MSRTDKWEHKTDSWNTCGRMERKARPAGRIKRTVQEELDAEEAAWWEGAVQQPIVVDDETWDALQAMLDADPEPSPELEALLTTPTVFDKED